MKKWLVVLILVCSSLVWAQMVCPVAPLVGIENEQTDGFPEKLATLDQRRLVINIALLKLGRRYYNTYVTKRDWSRFVAKAIAAANEHAFYDAMREWLAEFAQLDGQSQFLSAREMEYQSRQLARTGMHSAGSQPGPVFVTRLSPGGPMERAGVQLRDKILTVDDNNCWNDAMFLGEVGTSISLKVQTENQEPRVIIISREVLEYDPFIPLPQRLGGGKVGYIWMSGDIGTPEDVDGVLQGYVQLAKAPAIQCLILDLRGSRITSLEALEAIVAPFVTRTMYRLASIPDEPYNYIISPSKINWVQLPLVVLVDGSTVGISVWAAAILQRRAKTLVLGRRSAPMDMIWNVDDLPDGSQIKYASAGFRFSDGSSLPFGRVIPSVLLTDNWLDYSRGNDPYLRAALEALDMIK